MPIPGQSTYVIPRVDVAALPTITTTKKLFDAACTATDECEMPLKCAGPPSDKRCSYGAVTQRCSTTGDCYDASDPLGITCDAAYRCRKNDGLVCDNDEHCKTPTSACQATGASGAKVCTSLANGAANRDVCATCVLPQVCNTEKTACVDPPPPPSPLPPPAATPVTTNDDDTDNSGIITAVIVVCAVVFVVIVLSR